MKKTTKQKYSMMACTRYMGSVAWGGGEKAVPLLAIAQAVLAVAISLTELFIPPAVLGAMEGQPSVKDLVLLIAGLTLLLLIFRSCLAYVDAIVLPGRVTVRSMIIHAINKKGCTTAYCNTLDDAFLNLRARSQESTSTNRQATERCWTTFSSFLKNVLGFFIYLLLLSQIRWQIALFILILSLLSYLVGRHMNEYKYRHQKEEAEIEKHLQYGLNLAKDHGLAKDIRLFGMKRWIDELNEKWNLAYLAFQSRVQNALLWAALFDLFLTFLRNGAAYLYLIGQVLDGQISAAGFLLYFTAIGGFAQWISGILSDLSMLHRQSLDISAVLEFLHFPEPFQMEEGLPLKPEPHGRYELRMEHVSFRYPGASANTLTDVNLTLHPGEKLAIVGLNGAGKTTLVKLLCGFFDPTEGCVLLNGWDIREYNRRDYYTLFSAVFQTFSLIPGTVAANVAQSETEIDLSRVKACIAQAGLTEKIESLPEQYETPLNREVFQDAPELSGGQLQRLMLARALYKNAPVILLDEPTAALDPIAEADLYQKYNEMTKGRSSLYISHRLASTRFCDRIILLDDRGIAEEGTHEELMALRGRYAGLYEVQSRYYREEEPDHETV